MLRATLIAATLTAVLAGCGQAPASPANTAATANATKPLLLTDADMLIIGSGDFASGPLISGSIQPEKRADLRAEVSAVVLQVVKDNGDKVKKGDLLVRLDDTTIRDQLNSAEEARRAAEQAFDQAQRQLDRLQTLSSSGAVSQQSLEDAEIRRNNAQSDLVAARTRVVQARQQLERTEVRAPFDGVVSAREVSNGDTAQVGKALLKVIDPRSVRFEGFVPAEHGPKLAVGAPVRFRINGYGAQAFEGKVQRINPIANATTRQIGVIVSVDWEKIPTVAGLYAEGTVETESHANLMLPSSSLVIEGDKRFVWTLKDQSIHKTAVQIGQTDARTGHLEVLSGIEAGAQVLRHPSTGLQEGANYELASAATAAPLAANAQ